MATLVLRQTKGQPLTNSEVDGNFTNLNDELATKLPSATYNPADILTKIRTVDGVGSGLDADLLDGLNTSSTLPSVADKSSIVTRDSAGNTALNQLNLASTLSGASANFSGNVSVGTLNIAGGSLPVQVGGTGATTAQNARQNLGLVIGSDVQAYSSNLQAIATATAAANQLPFFTSTSAATTTTLSAYARTLIDDADAQAARSTLGLVLGTDVQPFDSDLSAIGALTTNGIIIRTSNGAAATRTITGTGQLILVSNGDGVSGNPTITIGADIPRLSASNTFSSATNTFSGDVFAATFQVSSDARLKENIQTLNNAVDIVNQLRGVAYIKDGRAEIGVIAQEVEQILPQVVRDDPQGYKTVAYGNVVGLLIEAIKEQQNTIKELTTRLEKLEK
jgi:hypothetical protein